MLKWMALAVGGVLGVFARCIVSDVVHKQFGSGFPIGTLVVNLTGCLLVGILLTVAEGKFLLGPHGRLMLITGFCGAYTTFSTWMLETQRLTEERQILPAVANLAVSVVLGIAAAMAGQWIASML